MNCSGYLASNEVRGYLKGGVYNRIGLEIISGKVVVPSLRHCFIIRQEEMRKTSSS